MPNGSVTRNIRLADGESYKSGILYNDSWAVIIGINDYEGRHQPLLNAWNDANEFASLLRNEFGYEKTKVITLLNKEASRDKIENLLEDELPKKIGPNDSLIFFFAGHGVTRETKDGIKLGYFIPQDARKDCWHDYLNMEDLLQACDLIRAKHIFLIIDCCFSGILAIAASRSEPQVPKKIDYNYLRKITERIAWQVLTAGDEDEIAADSGPRSDHSPFTGALLDGLRGDADTNSDGLITASELSFYVKQRVISDTSKGGAKGQVPFFNYLKGSRSGDFIFLSAKPKKINEDKWNEIINILTSEKPKQISDELNQLSEGIRFSDPIVEAIITRPWIKSPPFLISIFGLSSGFIAYLYNYSLKYEDSPVYLVLIILMLLALLFTAYFAFKSKTYTNLINLGIDFSLDDKYDEALKAYDNAINRNPKVAEAWYFKGNTLCDMGNYEDAIEHYKKAVYFRPRYADAWYHLGDALKKINRDKEADSAFAKARRLQYNKEPI